jgi:hypothetical protein
MHIPYEVLTMEKTKMVWTDEYQKEFEDIKQELVSDNIMIYPDWNEKSSYLPLMQANRVLEQYYL